MWVGAVAKTEQSIGKEIVVIEGQSASEAGDGYAVVGGYFVWLLDLQYERLFALFLTPVVLCAVVVCCFVGLLGRWCLSLPRVELCGCLPSAGIMASIFYYSGRLEPTGAFLESSKYDDFFFFIDHRYEIRSYCLRKLSFSQVSQYIPGPLSPPIACIRHCTCSTQD